MTHDDHRCPLAGQKGTGPFGAGHATRVLALVLAVAPVAYAQNAPTAAEPASPAPPTSAAPAASTSANNASASSTSPDSTTSPDAPVSTSTPPDASATTAPVSTSAPDISVHPFPRWSARRLALDLELVTQGRYTKTAGTDLSELRLDRGELGARVGLGDHAAAELRLEAIRSASDGGALGIDGNSTVVRVKYANVAGSATLGPITLDGAMGFVPDPWIRALEDGYSPKPLSRSGSERLLGWPTADLAALVRASIGPVRVAVSIGNGEGQDYPERNDGKTTTAVAEVVAVNTADIRATILAMGRDGSIGVARVRDRRAGGGATLITPSIRGGVEVVKAWGIGDRGDVEGVELGGWADATIAGQLHLAARGSSLGYTAGGRASTFGGAVAIEPWSIPTARVRVWLAVDRVTTSGAAMPLVGADAGDATTVMLIASANAPYFVD